MSNVQPEGIPGVGFFVAAFTDENLGDKALAELKEAKKKQQFYFEDAAVIKQDSDGKVTYYETGDMGGGKGAGIGALVGGVLGILGGPGGVVLGAGAGAAIGGIAASGDRGFTDENLNTMGVALKPGTSAMMIITSNDFLKEVHEKVPVEEIKTAVSDLSEELSAQLTAKKNVAIGLLLAEEGLAFTEIVADEDAAEVVGAVITGEGMITSAEVITDEGTAYKVAVATPEGAVMEAGVITNEGAPDEAAAMADAAAASGSTEDETES
jgi:uncharacterized membrane protein